MTKITETTNDNNNNNNNNHGNYSVDPLIVYKQNKET